MMCYFYTTFQFKQTDSAWTMRGPHERVASKVPDVMAKYLMVLRRDINLTDSSGPFY